MKKNSSMLLFLTMLIMGTTITISSNSWLMMWVGLEINMMSFLPLLANKKTMSETPMTYFLIQSLGSMILLFSIIIPSINMTITTMAIMLKMGAAPMHLWMIQVMEKMDWMNCLLLTTWQKIAPIVMLTNMKNMLALAMISIIIGAIGGLNQTSLRKMIAFSSINHIGWMMATMESSSHNSIKYLMIYSIMMILLVTMLMKKNMYYMNQLPETMTKMEKMNLTSMLLSMGGLPPFIGFTAKWIIIQEMINSNMTFMVTMMIMFSMITLFFYLRMITPLMMLETSTMKINVETNKNNILQPSMLFSNLFMLPMAAFTLL